LNEYVKEGIGEEAMVRVGGVAGPFFGLQFQGKVCLAYFATGTVARIDPPEKARNMNVFGGTIAVTGTA